MLLFFIVTGTFLGSLIGLKLFVSPKVPDDTNDSRGI